MLMNRNPPYFASVGSSSTRSTLSADPPCRPAAAVCKLSYTSRPGWPNSVPDLLVLSTAYLLAVVQGSSHFRLLFVFCLQHHSDTVVHFCTALCNVCISAHASPSAQAAISTMASRESIPGSLSYSPTVSMIMTSLLDCKSKRRHAQQRLYIAGFPCVSPPSRLAISKTQLVQHGARPSQTNVPIPSQCPNFRSRTGPKQMTNL